jgi:hypothetical protein
LHHCNIFLNLFKIILAGKVKTNYIIIKAEVVELVDTLCSGRSAREGVWVQIPPSAQIQTKATSLLLITLSKIRIFT